jgi:magnesium transporter
MSEPRFHHITSTGKFTNVSTLPKALAVVKKGGFLWLDYCKPTKEDLSLLINPLGVHPLSIEDCLDDKQIPKIDNYPRNTFMLFNAFFYSEQKLTISEVDVFIGTNFLITVGGQDAENRRLLRSLPQVAVQDIENARYSPAHLLHVILDYIVDEKLYAIEVLEDELNNAEESMLDDPAQFNAADLLRLRRDILALRKSLFHEREILVKINRKDCPFIPAKTILYFRDVYDHLAKFFELIESLRDVVTSLMEMYLTLLNNQMARAANETNLTVRRLTFITTVFMPLTLIAGIGGMSEWSMMTGPSHWRVAYPLFILAMFFIGIVNYYLFKFYLKRGEYHD